MSWKRAFPEYRVPRDFLYFAREWGLGDWSQPSLPCPLFGGRLSGGATLEVAVGYPGRRGARPCRYRYNVFVYGPQGGDPEREHETDDFFEAANTIMATIEAYGEGPGPFHLLGGAVHLWFRPVKLGQMDLTPEELVLVNAALAAFAERHPDMDRAHRWALYGLLRKAAQAAGVFDNRTDRERFERQWGYLKEA